MRSFQEWLIENELGSRIDTRPVQQYLRLLMRENNTKQLVIVDDDVHEERELAIHVNRKDFKPQRSTFIRSFSMFL
jgi:hypothetical protein